MSDGSDSVLGLQLKELKITKKQVTKSGSQLDDTTIDGSHEFEGIGVNTEMQLVSRENSENESPTPLGASQIEVMSDDAISVVSDDSLEWQEIPAVASIDVYGEKGELILEARNNTESTLSINEKGNQQSNTDANKGSFGYTKIDDEDQAKRSFVKNTRTEFLFNHDKLMVLNPSAGLTEEEIPTAGKLTEEEKGEEEEEEEEVLHTKNITSQEQLSITRDLLSETEKFAYLGAITVLINEMCTQLVTIALSSNNVTSKTKLAKRLEALQKNMGHWRNIILSRLYIHLEVQPAEVEMLSKLSNHNILLKDLCRCLQKTQKVKNSILEDGAEPQVQDDGEVEKGEVPSDNLDVDIAWTVICDLFLLLIQDSHYDSRSRSLLIEFAEVLNIGSQDICQFEKRIIEALELEQATEEQVWDEKDHMDKRRKANRRKKLYYIGMATLGGSLVLGLSGGLLAPAIGAGFAAGLSTVGITGASAFLTGIGGTTVVAVGSTAMGARIGTKSMQRRMGSVRTFEFRPLHNNRRLNLIISVSGWMNGNEDDVRLPFSTVDPINGDLYSLHWEPDVLKSTGQTMGILASEIVTQTIQQILGATVLTALMAAIQLPNMLAKLGYIIDNPWNVSLDRAWAAGLILADTLVDRNLGSRPITLVGFSLGSRVIYSCLLELAKKGHIGIVENVYLFGSPVVYKRDEMILARSVVSGRFVNGYSNRDWILGYLFRATGGGLSTVAGISPISSVPNIENTDCSELVDGHMSYRNKMPKLLKHIGISVLSEEFVEIEEPIDPEQVERQRKLVTELESAQNKLSEKSKKERKKQSWYSKSRWLKPQKDEWQKMYEETLKDKSSDSMYQHRERNESSSTLNEEDLMKGINKLKDEMKNDLNHASRDIIDQTTK